MNTVLTFDDQGQDFLRWVLDECGIVIGCEPFQESIWNGVRVLDFQNLTEGDLVSIETKTDVRTLKYPLIGITQEVIHG